MKVKYDAWIKDYLSRFEHPAHCLGKCEAAVEEMKKAFPELRVVKGHAYTAWGKRAHWWFESPEKKVVDPTAAQFSLIFEYEEYEEGAEVRLGKCANCGDEIWGPPEKGQQMMCSPECHNAYAAYLNGGGL